MNIDPAYIASIQRYADDLRRRLEERIAAGARLEDVAEEVALEADDGGGTLLVLDCAVHLLDQQKWSHSAALDAWYRSSPYVLPAGVIIMAPLCGWRQFRSHPLVAARIERLTTLAVRSRGGLN